MGRVANNAITRLSTTDLVDMQTAAKVDLYTVKAGDVLFVSHIVVRNLSASLAGGTDYDLGTGANADTWRQTIDLSSMTATTDCMIIAGADVTKYTQSDAADVFGIKVITGSTGAATASIDVFGFIV